jgi:hypothetical protein
LRIVDGRGNHWGWGSPIKLSDGSSSVSFNDRDSTGKGKELLLKNAEQTVFTFDIASRNKWTPFDSDGSAAPNDSTSQRFDFIQAIVIEPGFVTESSAAPNPDDSHKHDRHLFNSPESTNLEGFIKGALYISKISFD